MAHRIALASSTGKGIDQHFRQAHRFEIFDLEETHYTFIETRLRETEKERGHDFSVFNEIAQLLADCEGVFVSHIGMGAARYLNSIGLRVFEAPYPVDKVLEKLLTDGVFSSTTSGEENRAGKERKQDDR